MGSFFVSGVRRAVMEGVAGMVRVEGGGHKLGASHVEVLVNCEDFRFIVEVGNVSWACAACGNAKCSVLYGL